MNNGLEARVRAHLADLGAQGLIRQLRAPGGIDLSSNDYLGLARHPLLIERLEAAVRREGAGSTGSRLLRGHRDAFADVERRFARFKGTARSLYFSSGYLANLAVLTTLPEAGDIIFSDARNHASLIDGARLSRARRVVFPHNDTDHLAHLLSHSAGPGHRFVVVESLFSMDGDFAPLAEYMSMCERTGATLVVDEAHAVGVYGDDGSGLIRATGLDADRLISVNTAGKALGVAGAFVAGPTWVADYLEQRARPFVFSTAPPPALTAALDAALDLVADEPDRRQRLHRRVRRLRTVLSQDGLSLPPDTSQIIPVVVGTNDRAVRLATALQQRGFDVRAIRPPSVPAHTARLRISVNAMLSRDVLDQFAHALGACLQEVERCSAVSS